MITTLILTIIIALIMYMLKPLFFKDKSEQSQSEIKNSSNIANENQESDSMVQDNSSDPQKKAEEQNRKKSWIERNYWMLPVGIAIFLLKMCSDMMPNA